MSPASILRTFVSGTDEDSSGSEEKGKLPQEVKSVVSVCSSVQEGSVFRSDIYPVLGLMILHKRANVCIE